MEHLFVYIVIILSAVFHEYAHGWAAWRMGDPTAKNAGRLTLNPIAHIDPWGTVILPLFLLYFSGIFIGWAKPVPYNPYNLSDQKYGNLKVAIAGPGINLLIALVIGLVIRFAPLYSSFGFVTPLFLELLGFVAFVNIFLALFNLIPVPPLDGSKVVGDLFPGYERAVAGVGLWGVFIAIFLAFFIISPIAQFIFHIFTGVYFSF